MKRFKNILCIVNFDETSLPALENAVSLAVENRSSLKVVNVMPQITAGIGMPDGGPISADLQAAMKEVHMEKLEAIVDPFRERVKIQTKVLMGMSFLEITREVLRFKHDLVIKIPENPDWLEQLFGSDDMHLLRKCPCPVWMAKPQRSKSYKRILAAVDVDVGQSVSEMASRRALNLQILQLAFSLSLSDFAELHIVHVWRAVGENTLRGLSLDGADQIISTYVNQVQQEREKNLQGLLEEVTAGFDAELQQNMCAQTHIIKGKARREIPQLAEKIKADLIVMGTVASSAIQGLIMSTTAESILNQIDCSVMAIKPPGFVSPVELVE